METSKSVVTTDHKVIQEWVEKRGGRPATVKGTTDDPTKDPGLLRINFPGFGNEKALQEISWEEFFSKFEEKQLAFLFQEQTSTGKESRFFKLIGRTGPRAKENPLVK
ncbi:hypothetical protein HGA88_05570 [Candidatus Roizmanbacteria bacterium]|nr:hypothetical protein [Candidatus Roizmanbacteria bacterium]